MLNNYSITMIEKLVLELNRFLDPNKEKWPHYPILKHKIPIHGSNYHYYISKEDKLILSNILFHLNKIILIQEEDYVFLINKLKNTELIFGSDEECKRSLEIFKRTLSDSRSFLKKISD